MLLQPGVEKQYPDGVISSQLEPYLLRWGGWQRSRTLALLCGAKPPENSSLWVSCAFSESHLSSKNLRKPGNCPDTISLQLRAKEFCRETHLKPARAFQAC